MTPRDLFKQILLADLGSAPYLQDSAPQKTFRVIAKTPGTVCGVEHIKTVVAVTSQEFFLRDSLTTIKLRKHDGSLVHPGNHIAVLTGDAEVLLKAERTICNLLSRLSGIATATREQVLKLRKAGYGRVRLFDTRKSLSILRPLIQQAVRVGGGYGHRMNMADGIMIKDNDIAVYGGIREALRARLREQRAETKVEVEISNFVQLDELLMIKSRKVDIIMLDNMSLADMTKAVKIIRDTDPNYDIEASGIGKLDVVDVARTGVDYISSSSFVTKGEGNPLDISMKCVE